ncbi:MAG: hypothetical protein IBJ03_05440 [Gemmatimonadaceae bacterium]|nr:hypothetical protein [Gemmatimonadaceae bacterium]
MHLLAQLDDTSIVTAMFGLPSVRRSQSPPAIIDFSAGFIPFSLNATDRRGSSQRARIRFDAPFIEQEGIGYSFGIVIGLQQQREPQEQAASDEQLSPLRIIEGFPVLAEYREIEFAAPPVPLGAASACYARPRSSKRFLGPPWAGGIVIARHSLAGVGYGPGVTVPMLPSGALPVADVDGTTVIDAAILDCGQLPSSVTSLPLASAVAPGQNVTVRAVSGGFAASVLRVNDHPSYYGNLVAHRVFLDTPGHAGDSGSLVSISGPGSDCVGLYMGSTGGPNPEGLAQSMRQVVNYFDIELYD